MRTITKKTKLLLFVSLFILGLMSGVQAAWVNVGSQNFSPGAIGSPMIVIDTAAGTPYVAFVDGNNNYKASVMKFDGTAWNTLGSAGISPGTTFNYSFTIDKFGTPYIAYIDATLSNAINVKKFDGNDWVSLDGQNSCTAGGCYGLSIKTDANGIPYLAFNQYSSPFSANTLNVQKFDGSNWVAVGAPDISTSDADYISVAFGNNNAPYVGYRDKSSGYKATVRTFDGTDWLAVGQLGFSPEQADFTSIGIDNAGAVYMSYSEFAQYGAASVMKFDGSNWNFVGQRGFSAGSTAFNKLVFDNNNILHVVFTDGDLNYGTTVMKFTGNIWTSHGCPDVTNGQATTASMAFDKNNVAYVAIRDDSNNNEARVVKLVSNPINVIEQPVNQSTCGWTYIAEFSVDAQNVSSYQWQEYDGNGFTNINNSWPYNGANQNYLSVYYPVDYGKSGYKYRCLITADDCSLADSTSYATFNAQGIFTDYAEDVTICGSSNTAEYFVTNSDSVVTYQWKIYDENLDEYINLTDNSTYSGTNTNTFTITGVNGSMDDTYYECEVTTLGGCVVTSSAGLYVDTNPTISAQASSTTVCLGSEVTIWGEDGYYFQWDNGVDDDEAFTPTGTAIYTVNGFDWFGCPATASIEITTMANTLPVPVVSTSGPLSFCPGDSIILTATNTSASFLWSSGDSTSSITVSSMGEYSIRNYDEFGCVQNSQPVDVYSPILPSITINQTVDCNGSSIEISTFKDYGRPKDVDANGSVAEGYYIDGFEFAGINNQNSGCTVYENMTYSFYPSMMAVVNPGSTYSFTFTPPSNISSDVTHAIWIDFNNDGDFMDENEAIYTSLYSNSDWTMATFSDSLSIPSNATAGITRMRIRTSSMNSFYPNELGASRPDNGETEDYQIQIGNAAPFVYSWTSIPAGFTSNLAAPGIIPSLDTTYVLTWFTATPSPALAWACAFWGKSKKDTPICCAVRTRSLSKNCTTSKTRLRAQISESPGTNSPAKPSPSSCP